MSATNTAVRTIFGETYEGGRAAPKKGPLAIPDKQQLMRIVSSCLLFENTFYETGNEIAENLRALCAVADPADIAEIARVARTELRLRHVPLFLALQLSKRKVGKLASDTIATVVQRPDEMAELVSLYFKENGREALTKGHSKLPASMKRGLARAFQKFSAYQLAKWDQPKGVRLRDVLFLSHAKAKDEEQAALWKTLINGTIPPADTWEVALSAGADKKATWERLITEKKLGYMALLMNLRNMAEAGVTESLITAALLAGAPFSKAFPFRYVASAKAAPQYADALNTALLSQKHGQLGGRTAVVVDVSRSMVGAPISGRSKLDRLDAAGALAMFLRESCESVRVFGFTDIVAEVPNLRGLSLHAALRQIPNRGTLLGQCLELIKGVVPDYDRVVVVTDEQAHGMGDGRSNPLINAWTKYAYLINVSPYKPGLDTSGGWTRINGWSDRIVDWIAYDETGRIIGEDE